MKEPVGIDIDGVVCDSTSCWKKIAQKEGVTEDFLTTYNGIWKTYTELGDNFGKLLFSKYRDYWINKSLPFTGAARIVNSMYDNPKLDICFVTARGEDVKSHTRNWLSKHGFNPNIKVHHTNNKLSVPISTLIDDKPSHIEDFAGNARLGILMDAPYNRYLQTHYRVTNLTEAYNIIKQFL